MPHTFTITLELNDWANEIRLGHQLPFNANIFEQYPDRLQWHLEAAKLRMEEQYKKLLIEKRLHLKLINRPE